MGRPGVSEFGSPPQGVRLAVLFVAGVAQTIPATARTVLIIDDHPSARNVLEDAGFVVIGEAQNGASGLAAATAMRSAVVLLDIQLRDFDGFDVAASLTGQRDGPAVVLTSSRDGSEFGGMDARSGARGFVPKDELSGPALEALLG